MLVRKVCTTIMTIKKLSFKELKDLIRLSEISYLIEEANRGNSCEDLHEYILCDVKEVEGKIEGCKTISEIVWVLENMIEIEDGMEYVVEHYLMEG